MQDAKAVKQCIDRAYSPVKARLNDLPDVSAGVETEISDRIVFAAELAGTLVGCAVLDEALPDAQLVNIAVDPDFGGRGIGRLLIEKALAHARQAGASRMRLATHKDLPENIALYSHLGWIETGREGNKVLMHKAL